PPTLDTVVELRVLADRIVADEKPRMGSRVGGDQFLYHRNSRVAHRCDAEDQLVARVIKFEGCAERLLEKIVEAADRPDDAHMGAPRRIHARRLRDASWPTSPSRDNETDDMEQKRGAAE